MCITLEWPSYNTLSDLPGTSTRLWCLWEFFLSNAFNNCRILFFPLFKNNTNSLLWPIVKMKLGMDMAANVIEYCRMVLLRNKLDMMYQHRLFEFVRYYWPTLILEKNAVVAGQKGNCTALSYQLTSTSVTAQYHWIWINASFTRSQWHILDPRAFLWSGRKVYDILESTLSTLSNSPWVPFKRVLVPRRLTFRL